MNRDLILERKKKKNRGKDIESKDTSFVMILSNNFSN